MNKKRIVIFISLLGLFLVVGKTISSLQGSPLTKDQGVFSSEIGDIKVIIEKKGENQSQVIVNQKNTNEAKIVNEGNKPILVRVMIQPTIISSKGVHLEARLNKQIKINGVDSTSWIEGEDGYLYLIRKIDKDDSELLFNSWELIETGIDDSYKDGEMQMTLKIEAINIRQKVYIDSWWEGTEPSNEQPNLQWISEKLKQITEL